jgi:hypothetical protein
LLLSISLLLVEAQVKAVTSISSLVAVERVVIWLAQQQSVEACWLL